MIKIAVCGAPRSGNRLVQRMLQRHGFIAEVRHYGSPQHFRVGGYADRAVLPVREREAHRASCLRDWKVLPRPDATTPIESVDDVLVEHFLATMRRMAIARCSVLPVSYETIVADPEKEGRRIVDWCAAPGEIAWRGWGEEIVDGNAKWATGAGA